MSKSEPQNLKNHGRLDPPYHFVLAFVLLANLIVSIVYVVRHPCFYSAWFVRAVAGGVHRRGSGCALTP